MNSMYVSAAILLAINVFITWCEFYSERVSFPIT